MLSLKLNKETLLKNVKDMSAYFSAALIPMLLNLVVNPFIAMNMSPHDYGIVGYYTSFNSLIQPLIVFYMVQYYIRNYFNVNEDQRLRLKSVIFKGLISFSLFLSVLCYVGIAFYIHIFNPNIEFPVFPYLLMTIAAIPLTGIYTLQTADYRMSKSTGVFFRVTVAYGLINIVFNILYVVALKWGAFGKLLAPLFTNALFFVWILYKNRELITIRTTWKEFVDVLRFCWPLALGAMLGYFSGGFDKTYLESLKDSTTYGYYIVGGQMAGYISVFANAISTTFQPDVYEAIIKGWKGKLIKTYAIQMVLILFVVLAFVVLCPYIIKILTAGRYVASTPFARVICFSTFASALYFNINGYTIGKGYPQLYTLTTLLGSIGIILLMPIMVNKFGFYGAGMMTSINYLILSVVNIILLLIVGRGKLSGIKTAK
jgi:O-antigen/teichoic acid export membrane protein